MTTKKEMEMRQMLQGLVSKGGVKYLGHTFSHGCLPARIVDRFYQQKNWLKAKCRA